MEHVSIGLSFLGVLSLPLIWGVINSLWVRVEQGWNNEKLGLRFKPIRGRSSAACGYVFAKGVASPKLLTATLIELALKGHIAIDISRPQRIAIYVTPSVQKDVFIGRESVSVLKALFEKDSNNIILDGEINPQIVTAYTALKQSIESTTRYRKFHIGYHVMGAIFTVFGLALFLSDITGLLSIPTITLNLSLLGLAAALFLSLPLPSSRSKDRVTKIVKLAHYLKNPELSRQKDDDNPDHNGAPTIDKAHYELLLPHAIAFNAEQEWTQYFGAQMPLLISNYTPNGVQINKGVNKLRADDICRTLNDFHEAITFSLNNAPSQPI